MGAYRHDISKSPDEHVCSQSISVESITIHESYNAYLIENDIALLYLSEDARCAVITDPNFDAKMLVQVDGITDGVSVLNTDDREILQALPSSHPFWPLHLPRSVFPFLVLCCCCLVFLVVLLGDL